MEEESGEDEQQRSEGEPPSSWERKLWDALQGAAPPGSFACGGALSHLPWLCPEVAVEGVGQLALPLCPEQAATLRAAAQQAPYGKGLDTLVDRAVRDALQVRGASSASSAAAWQGSGGWCRMLVLWHCDSAAGCRVHATTPLALLLQVDAARVTIGASWQPVLRRAVQQVAQQLGLPDGAAASIDARLYKLLLYEQGGHFAAHQDTEKEPGMFGTLVVQLPCAGGHEGGRLLVRHKGKQFKHDFAQVEAWLCHACTMLLGGRLWLLLGLVAAAPPSPFQSMLHVSGARLFLHPCCRTPAARCSTPPSSPTASTSWARWSRAGAWCWPTTWCGLRSRQRLTWRTTQLS
jgi:hypothetical protein